MADFHTYMVGGIEVITLVDGFGRAPNALFPAFDADRASAAAAQSGEGYDGNTVNVPINGFAIRNGDDVTIVDAGAPDGYSDTTGAYLAALAAAGIDPADVNRLAMTHLHVDHVGQMATADGTARFSNADLISGHGDWDHFFDDAIYARSREGSPMRASLDHSRRNLRPYADQRREVTTETEVAPGITMVPLPGHTPGHCGVMVHDGDDSLLIWGDVIHSAAFQLAEPEWGVLFDVDGAQAVETRKALFDRVSADNTIITGPHVPVPGPWQVVRAPIGYRLDPI